ncbi:hypothetical protein ABID82_000666 [Methylobacterium sp. PvP062]|jgi:hypothetical protein|uniref:Uncharacterized protein n=1 Tax=Methylobacterium radiotolerans TaxID=31998 RepID=A0ABV2NI07_9HYPH|nr:MULTISPECIES: hypothetical protein [Methylobacterium]MCX7333974.1 hypothetical protein [Hyphomicrobiales bacterium]GAN51682.1 ThiJ/PfpI family protein [Methylobacterium sp. ME121]KIU30436.1 hypothetical protein SR39_20950 [Methylobacterium radiotolerans]KZB97335.1 hypothetical protein AU375_06529 [Methylobacterium radiotolerans]MBN6820076.1 hypothetical protein [Methylobacterium organophilum]
MTRAQERLAARQAATARQELDGYERDLAAWQPEPPEGILPWAHQAYRHGLLAARDDLRRELGLAPAATAITTATHEARG